jgi:gamma-glutamyltranspeptidase/glutathione hydrolase
LFLSLKSSSMVSIIPVADRSYEFKSHLKLGIIVGLWNLAEGLMRRLYGLGGILFLMSGSGVMAESIAAYDRVAGLPHASRSEVIAPHGIAATSQPLATQVALDILKAGGTAVDAAIAANAALGLMEPTGCGIGGDLFAIVWDAENRQLAGLNASGRAPALMTIEYFREQGLDAVPPLGPLPVSVPGAIDGWYELHGRYGRLPMDQILAPAIRYAREGFPVSEVIASCRAAIRRKRARSSGTPGSRKPTR